ncbi:MAG: Dihydrolipoamide acetyltransferase component of pyruvate dehydrogenase complex, partial [uncultured Nocardioidaceae bacterium]
PDHQPAAGGDPRHRHGREAPRGHRRREPRRDDRRTADVLPGADLRPPTCRRRRRRPVPQRRQAAARDRPVRGL